MKIQIDTKNKIIKIEEVVNLKKFIEFISNIFPKGEWENYSLETKVIKDWVNPIIVKEYPYCPPYNPMNPYWAGYEDNKMLCLNVN